MFFFVVRRTRALLSFLLAFWEIRYMIVNMAGEEVLLVILGKKKDDESERLISFSPDVIEDKDMTPKVRRVLLYIASKADPKTFEVYLFPEEVSQELSISRQTYFRAIKTLIKKGYIRRLGRYRYKVKVYRFTIKVQKTIKD